jgi:cytochrome P450
MMNNPHEYKDPERFMPERFLGENHERDPRELAFGFGRRYCHQPSTYL